MTDAAQNGNSKDGLLRQIAETKERLAAWGFRGLIFIVSGMLTVTVWLAKEQLSDIKTLIATSNTSLWTAVGSIAQSANKNTNAIGQLTTTVTDRFEAQGAINQEIRETQADHEKRIRAVETRP